MLSESGNGQEWSCALHDFPAEILRLVTYTVQYHIGLRSGYRCLLPALCLSSGSRTMCVL